MDKKYEIDWGQSTNIGIATKILNLTHDPVSPADLSSKKDGKIYLLGTIFKF
ncbi:hypothetical protein HOB87_00505 [Candidatus Woesearchaeota archaeon]|jgi:hypothetical protein|nr:hypothetical protein [Candidatus Woesearchaeota archaeon]